MRKLLLVLTLVVSFLGVGGVTERVGAFECEFCELVGQIEGSGIIFPDWIYGHQMYWQGRFDSVLVRADGPVSQPVSVSEHEYNFLAWGTLHELNPVGSLPIPEGTLLQGSFRVVMYETWDSSYEFPVHEFEGEVRGTADLSNTGVVPSSWAFTRVDQGQSYLTTYSQAYNIDSRFRGVGSFGTL